MLSNLVNEFKIFEANKQEEINKTNTTIAEYEVILIDFTTEYKAINFFKRLFAFAKRKQLRELKAFIAEKEALSRQYNKEIVSKKQSLNDNYINQLIMSNQENNAKYEEINKRVQLATDLYNIIHKTKKAGDYVLKEISEARSAISSAKSMETVDMFTKDKTISMLSSMSTNTARSEVNDVGPAINKFKKELEYTRLKVNEVQLDSLWTTLDFVFDMSDNGFMDTFSSFMVMNSLDNTDGQLYNVAVTIEQIMTTINKDHAEIKSQLDTEQANKTTNVENFRIKAKLELNDLGISI
jgi:hydrogenase maturation factor